MKSLTAEWFSPDDYVLFGGRSMCVHLSVKDDRHAWTAQGPGGGGRMMRDASAVAATEPNAWSWLAEYPKSC